MEIAMAQLNPVVGDVTGNVERLSQMARAAAHHGAELVIFPELCVCGYPPLDLLERQWFIRQVQDGVAEVARFSGTFDGVGILFGAPVPTGRSNGKSLYNAALLAVAGEIAAIRSKALLPTYDVFDEARYFSPAADIQVVPFKGERLGIHVCEDAWTDLIVGPPAKLYDQNPVAELVAQGATMLINISASPFSVGKELQRQRMLAQHAQRAGVPFAYVNQVGGNDELIFDGNSLCLDERGRVVAAARAFDEDLVLVDLDDATPLAAWEPQEGIASVHDALVLGLRDYCQKCGFERVVMGLSGGIDSAVTCALAVRALGPERVWGISMPSRYSSQGSLDDARALAENLGIRYDVIPIAPMHQSYLDALAPYFSGLEPDVAEENIQARIRGNILMAMSNKFGHLLLTTGNKSELAVGYCTLYGDMSGGLAVISDVPKTMVYRLARYINRDGNIIPEASICKPPSAELRPNQTDQDTLPPYEVLDAILERYVEQGLSVAEIAAMGYDRDTVHWVARTVDRNEFKRKQAAPGLRVTTKAFGIGRRMPIAARLDSARHGML